MYTRIWQLVGVLAHVDLVLCGTDLAKQTNLCFKRGAQVDLAYAQNLPYHLDVSCCAQVNLSSCDLSELAEVHFMHGAKVDLSQTKNLPKNLDVSECAEVIFKGTNLKGVENLCFAPLAKVELLGAYNLPKHLDVSRCSKVDLMDCDLSKVKTLVFKNQQQQLLSQAYFPKDWKGQIIYSDDISDTSKDIFKVLSVVKAGRRR